MNKLNLATKVFAGSILLSGACVVGNSLGKGASTPTEIYEKSIETITDVGEKVSDSIPYKEVTIPIAIGGLTLGTLAALSTRKNENKTTEQYVQDGKGNTKNTIINIEPKQIKDVMNQTLKLLKNEGDIVTLRISDGTTIDIIRGESFELLTRTGEKGYKLYKQVITPSGDRYATSANSIRNELYVNEVFKFDVGDKIPKYRFYSSQMDATKYDNDFSKHIYENNWYWHNGLNSENFSKLRDYPEALILGKAAKNPTKLHSGFDYFNGAI